MVVDALAARRDLDATEQQVEAARDLAAEAAVGVAVRMRVEGPGGAGVLGDEHEVAALGFRVVLAQQTLGFRVEVLAADHVPVLFLHERAGVQQGDARNMGGHVGNGGAQQVELGLRGGFQAGHDAGQQAVLEAHDVFLVLDEAHLDVQAQVLVQVAARGVLLGAVHGRDLEHAFEHADHDLLVQLRALREVRGMPEVVDGEQVRAALRACRDDLGRADLGEPLGHQVIPERGDQFGLYLQRGAFLQAAHGHHAVVQHGFRVDVPFHLGNLDRAGLHGGADHAELTDLHLEPAGRLGVRLDGARDLHAALRERQVQALADALRDAAHVAQHHELHAAQVAAGVHEALQAHGLAVVVFQVAGEGAGQALLGGFRGVRFGGHAVRLLVHEEAPDSVVGSGARYAA